MLHIDQQPEPANFDAQVRQKGLTYLRNTGFDLTKPLPRGSTLSPYWRACLPELYASYGGVCAYLAIHFERVIGADTVDHFAPKSKRADQAYEWSNFRLACSRMNSRKYNFQDVLDPFLIDDGYFRIELVSGRIYPNPELDPAIQGMADKTIKRLKLDNAECREIRARHFSEFTSGDYTQKYLKKISPFVWYEAKRQGLL